MGYIAPSALPHDLHIGKGSALSAQPSAIAEYLLHIDNSRILGRSRVLFSQRRRQAHIRIGLCLHPFKQYLSRFSRDVSCNGRYWASQCFCLLGSQHDIISALFRNGRRDCQFWKTEQRCSEEDTEKTCA